MFSKRYTLAQSAALVLFAVAAHGQTVTGSITGVVRDPNAAIIIGATVKATNAGTGVEFTTATGENGFYVFPALTPGRYTLTVSSPGFRTAEVAEQRLTVADVIRQDVTLAIGQVTESITVEASGIQVNTVDAQLGRAIIDIPDLPILSGAGGRNPLTLLLIQPGVHGSGTVGVSVNGQRGRGNNFSLDGGDSNNSVSNEAQGVNAISPNAVSEFRLVTGAMKAEYGRNSGGTVEVITKSGSNQFHGGLSEQFRNTKLNSVPFFVKSIAGGTPTTFSNGLPRKPQWNTNDFDANFGGRVIRDRTFFFVSYLGFRRRQGQPTSAVVFTDAERAAIEQRGVPEARALLGLVPRALEGNILLVAPADALDRNQGVARLDHNFNSRNRLSATYFIEDRVSTSPFHGTSPVPGFGVTGKSRVQNLIFRDTHTFGGSLLNEARFSVNRNSAPEGLPQNQTPLASLGLTGVIPAAPQYEGPPSVNIAGRATFGNSIFLPQIFTLTNYHFVDQLSWVKGRHTFKFGGEYRHFVHDHEFHAFSNGIIAIDGSGTALGAVPTVIPGLNNALNDFAHGFATAFIQGATGTPRALRSKSIYLFAQDDWRVLPRLTLNLGVRWEFNSPLVDANDRVAAFRPGQQSTVYSTAPVNLVYPGDTGISKSTYSRDLNNFAPRIGLAWDVTGNGKVAVRAGYGVFFENPVTLLTLQFLLTPPYAIQPQVLFTRYANPWPSSMVSPIPQPMPFTPPATGENFNFRNVAPISLAGVMDPNYATPYVQNWNFNTQIQLARGWVAEAGYVGSGSRRLPNRRELNFAQVGPGATAQNVDARRVYNLAHPQRAAFNNAVFARVINQLTDVNASFNSLQVSLNKRFSGGIHMTQAYTWGHTIDNGSDLSHNARADFQRLERGRSTFDVRHRYVGSWIYELPFYKTQRGAVGKILGGWGFSGILTLQTGAPFDIIDPEDRSLTGAGAANRPDYIGGTLKFFDPRLMDAVPGRPNSYFDGTGSATATASGSPFFRRVGSGQSFALGAGRFGNLGRNVFSGPGIHNWDIAVFKMFRLFETHRLEFRTESFNFANHTQFAAPNANIASPVFGRVTGTQVGPRILQLSLRYLF